MRRIVFLDQATLDAELRPPAFAHAWVSHASTGPDQVAERLAGAHIAVTNKVPIRRDVIARLTELEMIQVAATGVDPVDVEACRERGIVVSNVRDYATEAVAEHTLMAILMLLRRLLAYRDAVEDGVWTRASTFSLFHWPIRELRGAVVGIVGHGAIGRRVAELAAAFGAKVLVADRRAVADLRPGRTPFFEVLERADVLSLHCALTPETRGLLGANELRRMQPSAVVVNTARGPLIDSTALLSALDAGRLAGAAIDVLDAEPPPPEAPLVGRRRPDLLVTPHCAWASRSAIREAANQVIDGIEGFVRGEPRNVC